MKSERTVGNPIPSAQRTSGQDLRPGHLVLVVFLVALLTLFVRVVNLRAAYDIFLDEVTYLFLSESVAENLGVRLHGETFYLHPPVFFYLEGAYLGLFQPDGDIVQRVYAVRYLNVALAGVSGALIFLIGRAAVDPVAGVLAALIYALDPLSIRLGNRNMLEVAAMTWVLAGLLIILPLAPDGQQRRPPWWRIVAAGILFGLAMLTKDMMVFFTLLPLALCTLLRRCMMRRTAVSIGMIAVLVYALHPLSVWLSGDWARFVEKKTRGIERLIGLVQETGFNRPVGPGLFAAVLDKLGEFGATYLLFALGVVALLVLWKWADARGRLVAVWAASAYILLAYLIPVGTLEAQFFYYLLVPAALVAGMAAVLLFRQKVAGTAPGWLGPAWITVLGLIFLWSVGQWVHTRVTQDNGYERVLTFVSSEIPTDMKVAATSETAQFLLDERASGPWGNWYSLNNLAMHRPDYLIVSERQLEWDHGERALPLLDWLEKNGQPVFSFMGRTNEQLVIFYLPPASWTTLPSGSEKATSDRNSS